MSAVPFRTLSPEMVDAYDYAKANGDVLVRHQGGFWGASTLTKSFGTKTVHALVTRGVAEYTQWKEGRNGRFPIAIVIKALPALALLDGETGD